MLEGNGVVKPLTQIRNCGVIAQECVGNMLEKGFPGDRYEGVINLPYLNMQADLAAISFPAVPRQVLTQVIYKIADVGPDTKVPSSTLSQITHYSHYQIQISGQCGGRSEPSSW